MSTFTWFDFLWPVIIGVGVSLLVQFSKEWLDSLVKLATVAYAGIFCLLFATLANIIVLDWTWPATFLFAILAFAASQAWYLFGRGILKKL